jgi:hypothetical protein
MMQAVGLPLNGIAAVVALGAGHEEVALSCNKHSQAV